MSIQLARVNTALKQPVGTPWPETFTPGQIAWLLTWTNDSTKYKEWSRDSRLWGAMINGACECGELDHTTTTETIQLSESRLVEDGRITPSGLGGRFASLRQGYWEPAKTKEITTRHITAQNAARWLEVQQHPPGEMLQAWFKVRGVATGAQVLELVQPASAADAAAKPAQDATNDQWWLTWCSERIAANTKPDGSRKEGKARTPWTDDDVRVFDLRLSTLIGRGQAESAAKNAIASDLKTSVQALRLPLEKRDALQVNANNQQSRKVN